jgi:hypothetical protein
MCRLTYLQSNGRSIALYSKYRATITFYKLQFQIAPNYDVKEAPNVGIHEFLFLFPFLFLTLHTEYVIFLM